MSKLTALALAMIAIHEIQRPGPRKGVLDTIVPGSVFTASSEDEYKYLHTVGAARPAPQDEVAEDLQGEGTGVGDQGTGVVDQGTGVGDQGTAPVDEEDDDDLPPAGDQVDLTKLGVKALRKMLTAKEIAFDPAANQEQLISLLTPAATDDDLV